MLRRPVQHLIPLEIRSDGEQTEGKVESTLPVKTQREDSSLQETNKSKSRKNVVVRRYLLQSQTDHTDTV